MISPLVADIISGIIAVVLAVRIFKYIKITKEEYALGLLNPNEEQ